MQAGQEEDLRAGVLKPNEALVCGFVDIVSDDENDTHAAAAIARVTYSGGSKNGVMRARYCSADVMRSSKCSRSSEAMM